MKRRASFGSLHRKPTVNFEYTSGHNSLIKSASVVMVCTLTHRRLGHRGHNPPTCSATYINFWGIVCSGLTRQGPCTPAICDYQCSRVMNISICVIRTHSSMKLGPRVVCLFMQLSMSTMERLIFSPCRGPVPSTALCSLSNVATNGVKGLSCTLKPGPIQPSWMPLHLDVFRITQQSETKGRKSKELWMVATTQSQGRVYCHHTPTHTHGVT